MESKVIQGFFRSEDFKRGKLQDRLTMQKMADPCSGKVFVSTYKTTNSQYRQNPQMRAYPSWWRESRDQRALQLRAEQATAMRVQSSLLNIKGTGRLMPPVVQKRMEKYFDENFNDVMIHTGPQAKSIGAKAFTAGSDIYFPPGVFKPHDRESLSILAHELTHVIQQRQGRVKNPFENGIAIIRDPDLDMEANLMSESVFKDIYVKNNRSYSISSELKSPYKSIRKSTTGLIGKDNRNPEIDSVFLLRENSKDKFYVNTKSSENIPVVQRMMAGGPEVKVRAPVPGLFEVVRDYNRRMAFIAHWIWHDEEGFHAVPVGEEQDAAGLESDASKHPDQTFWGQRRLNARPDPDAAIVTDCKLLPCTSVGVARFAKCAYAIPRIVERVFEEGIPIACFAHADGYRGERLVYYTKSGAASEDIDHSLNNVYIWEWDDPRNYDFETY